MSRDYQHYIPRLYLRNFSSNLGKYNTFCQTLPIKLNEDQVKQKKRLKEKMSLFCMDKITKTIESRKISKIASENNFLDKTIDKILTQSENSAASIIKKIIESGNLKIFQNTTSLYSTSLPAEALEYFKIYQFVIFMANRTLSARKKIGTIYDTNDTKTIHGQLLSGEKKTKNKIRKFHSQTVIFLGVNDSDTYFITSDNPVIEPVSKKESFFVKLNNFEIEANFILPINSKYALIFVNRESAIKYFNTFPNEGSPIIKTSVNNPILFYNQALFKTANQYLFAERKKELEMLM